MLLNKNFKKIISDIIIFIIPTISLRVAYFYIQDKPSVYVN